MIFYGLQWIAFSVVSSTLKFTEKTRARLSPCQNHGWNHQRHGGHGTLPATPHCWTTSKPFQWRWWRLHHSPETPQPAEPAASGLETNGPKCAKSKVSPNHHVQEMILIIYMQEVIAAERDKGGMYSLEAEVREYLQNPCFAGSGVFSSVWTSIIWRMPSIARWVQLDLLHGCHPSSISHGTQSCSKDPKISKHHKESNYTQTPEIHGNSTSIHPTKQETHGKSIP